MEWWSWLIATGVFMACTWGSKVNGILTVFAIGVAVLADLWDILDIRKGYTMVCLHRFGLDFCANVLITGPLYTTLCGKSHWPDSRPRDRVPLLLLCTFRDPHTFWHWRYVHESLLPGDVDRQRATLEQSR